MAEERSGLSVPEDLVPASLLGDLVPGEVLGRGGYGIVFRAFQKSLDREVVVKVARLASQHDPAVIVRVRREAEVLMRLRHPNVCSLLDFGFSEEHAWFLFPLVGTEDLAKVIDRQEQERRPPDLEAGTRWLRQCLEALGAIHATGNVHRDLKPANLVLTAAGDLQVIDLGLVRGIRTGRGPTRSGAVVGSPGYMAPEQMNGEPPDPRDDLYSAGVVFYEFFSGENPFAGTSFLHTSELHFFVRPRSLSQRFPGFPARLSDTIDRLLGKTREGRPACAEEALDYLRGRVPGAVLDPDSEAVRRSAQAPTAAVGAQRRARARLLGASLLATLVVLAGGLALAATLARRPGSGEPGGGSTSRASLHAGSAGGATVPGAGDEASPGGPGNELARDLRRGFDQAIESWWDAEGRRREEHSVHRFPDALALFGVAILDTIPAEAAVFARMADGETVQTMTPEIQAALRDHDRAYQELGYPPPFRPFLDARPRPFEGSIPAELRALGPLLSIERFRPPPPGDPSAGWWQAALDLLAEGTRLRTDVETRYREGKLGLGPELHHSQKVAVLTGQPSESLDVLLGSLRVSPQGRDRLAEITGVGREICRDFTVAALRLLEFPESDATEDLLAVLVLGFVHLDGFLMGSMLSASPIRLFGRPAGTPAARRFQTEAIADLELLRGFAPTSGLRSLDLGMD